jgi:hypothetical protein
LTPERPLSLVVGRAAPEAGGDPRVKLGKVDRTGEGVVGTGLKRPGDGFRIRITEQYEARNPLPRDALESPEKLFERLVHPMDGDEGDVGRAGTDGGQVGIVRLRHMKSAPDQGPLESLRTHRRVPEKKDAG